MAGEIIRIGDSTSHGGTVLEGSMTDICMGKPIAFIGHKVQCPLCRGAYPIIEGAPVTLFFGKGVALAGMKTACGAVLIASQFTDVVELGGKTCNGTSQAQDESADAAPHTASHAHAGAANQQESPAFATAPEQDVEKPADISATSSISHASTGADSAALGTNATGLNPASTRAALSVLAPAVVPQFVAASQDAQAATLEKAAEVGAPFCQICTFNSPKPYAAGSAA